MIKKLFLSILCFVSMIALSGCSKEGKLENIDINNNKTTVYYVHALQDSMYSNAILTNDMAGKHDYTFETDTDGKTVNTFIWTWTLDSDIVRATLKNLQPDKVDEEAMTNCYNYVDKVMHYDARVWNINYGENKKAPSYVTITYSKSQSEPKTTVQVMIDLTSKKLDLTKENVQYEELSNYIWPGLYNEKTHTYQVSKERIKKAIPTLSNSKRIEEQLPILSKGYTVKDELVKTNELKSKEIEDFVKEAHKNKTKSEKKSK